MSLSRTLRRLVPLLVLALLARAVHAHDFWIAPSSFRPQVDTRVSVDLQVGEHWLGEAVARNPERIVLFAARTVDGAEKPLVGIDGKVPAGFWRPASVGAACLVYRSSFASLSLDAPKFEKYLASEGLEHIQATRAERGQTDRPSRERYARCAKSLVWVGAKAPESDATIDTALGLPLEITVSENPYALKPGAEITVQVTFQGRPLAGVLVGCAPKSAPETEVRKRSDADGRASFTLDRASAWLVRGVHMIACPDPAAADWESYWASVTFEIAK